MNALPCGAAIACALALGCASNVGADDGRTMDRGSRRPDARVDMPGGDAGPTALSDDCAIGETQRCFIGDPALAGHRPCFWGEQTCELRPGEFGEGMWGRCLGSGSPELETCNGLDDDCNGLVDDGPAAGSSECVTRACDALPPTLGGRRVIFDVESSTWVIQTDADGHPIAADGTVAAMTTCTIHVERIESGDSLDFIVPPAAKEVFFQLVGGGGGGGRHHTPPSTGGGAGAFATGIIDIAAAATPVTLSASAGVAGGTFDARCSEDACGFTCTCGRGAGDPGTASTLTLGTAVITASGGEGGSWAVSAAGGTNEVTGVAPPDTVVALNEVQSRPGTEGSPGGAPGNSGPGGSAACDWGSGANDNQDGSGYGGGGGGGNNSPAGAGSGGLIIVMWAECT